MTIINNTLLPPSSIFLLSNSPTTLLNGSQKSNILFELRNKIVIPPNVRCYIQLNNFRFVNSIYNININNNKFYYAVHHSGIYENITVTLPFGNYSITSILQYLNSACAVHHMDFTYVDTTFKVLITVGGGHTIHLNNGANNCFKALGFINYDTTTYVSSLLSDSIINLSGTQVLYISLENVNISSNGCKSNTVINVIESITMDVLIGSSQSFSNVNNHKFLVNENYINSIQVKIYDENSNLVDFNNCDWFLSLGVLFSYENQYLAPQTLDLNNNKIPDNLEDLDPGIQENAIQA